MMRKLSSLTALGLLVLGCEGTGPTAPLSDGTGMSLSEHAAGPVAHRVSMGSADVCAGLGLPAGCDANQSLVAIEFANGTVKGQWHDQFAGGVGVHVAVACVSVSGNQAWVSGTVTNQPFAGENAIIQLEDNGQSGDRASFTNGTANPDDCLGQPDLTLWDVTNGQVKIK